MQFVIHGLLFLSIFFLPSFLSVESFVRRLLEIRQRIHYRTQWRHYLKKTFSHDVPFIMPVNVLIWKLLIIILHINSFNWRSHFMSFETSHMNRTIGKWSEISEKIMPFVLDSIVSISLVTLPAHNIHAFLQMILRRYFSREFYLAVANHM
jgi:hypothetical protein